MHCILVGSNKTKTYRQLGISLQTSQKIIHDTRPMITSRRIGSSSHNGLRLNYIMVVFDYVTIHFLWISSIFVSETSPTFRKRKLIYLHCFDLGAQESVQFDQFPCLQVKLVLDHVSFPEKIAERRMCCYFLFQDKVINLLKNCRSPVLSEVVNSCNIKASFSAIHFLVFCLAFNCSFILCST